MALQQPAGSGSDISSGRYSERRAPSFIGGNEDPQSGNVIPVSRAEAARPSVAGVSRNPVDAIPGGGKASADQARAEPSTAPSLSLPPPPSAPSTRLGGITADTSQSPVPVSLGRALGGAGVDLVGSYAAPTLGANLGAQIGAGVPVGEALGSTASNAGSLLMGAPQVTAANSFGTGLADPIGSVATDVTGSAASGLSSTLGGAAGAGILSGVTSLASDLIGGKSFGEAAPKAAAVGLGSAAGWAIGTAILPGIGGILGSMAGGFLGGLFCHAEGTLIRMEDGSLKKIEDIQAGDRVWLGGQVRSHDAMIVWNIHRYRGTLVTGGHAVFEYGRFIRVEDSPLSECIELETPIFVHFLETEHHLLACERYLCADQMEVEGVRGAPEKLEALNGRVGRNAVLDRIDLILREVAHWQPEEIARLRILAPIELSDAENHARAAA